MSKCKFVAKNGTIFDILSDRHGAKDVQEDEWAFSVVNHHKVSKQNIFNNYQKTCQIVAIGKMFSPISQICKSR